MDLKDWIKCLGLDEEDRVCRLGMNKKGTFGIGWGLIRGKYF